MKRKLISCLLVLSLVVTLASSLTVNALDSSVHVDRIVSATVEFFIGHEGQYGSVTRYDNGACSIGKLQWHGNRALLLLKRIVGKNSTQAAQILGSTLYNEVTTSADSAWKSRALTVDEGNRISKLLVTAEGKAAQDEQAYIDISGYIDHGYSQGVRTDAALMYWCDIENQYGYGNAINVTNYAKAALGRSKSATINSLDEYYYGVTHTSASLVQNYISRRKTTYNYIKNTLGWNTAGSDTGCQNCPGAAFYDMPMSTDWSHAGIDFVLSAGLFQGVSSTSFAPQSPMTRAMLVTVLYRLSGTPTVSGSSSFEDVAAGAWYASAVCWAENNDIISGTDDGIFSPESNVTREQMAAILYRYTVDQGYPVGEASSSALKSFPDKGSVSDYAEKAMAWANEMGLIQGETQNGVTKLNPKDNATRAQVATIIMRYVNAYGA